MNKGIKYADRRSWDRFDSPEYDRLPAKHRGYSDERAGDSYVPDVFSSLRLTDINPRVPDQEVREAVYAELKRFGEFNVKFAHTVDRRLVYVNFAYSEDAYAAKQALTNRLFLFERPVCVEAVYHKQGFNRHGNGRDPGGFYRSGSPFVPAPRHFSDSYDPYPPRYDGYDDGHYRDSIRREPKFPHHLNHVPPEDDEKATRTLFVGNVDHEMTSEELSKYFEPYGVVEDVNIKHPPQGGGNPYAFVRFFHLDMANAAKVKLSGQMLGRFQCKIGYGKPVPTCCVWVGGLGHWVSKNTLGKEFERFGRILRIEWPSGYDYAFIEYDGVEMAREAIHEMRGFVFRGAKRGIRIDFAEPRQMEELQPESPKYLRRGDGERSSRRRRSRSYSRTYSSEDDIEFHSKKRSRHSSLDRHKRSKENKRMRKTRLRDDDDSDDSANPNRKKRRSMSFSDSVSAGSHFDAEISLRKKDKVFQIGNIEAAETVLDLARCLPIVWSGSLVLKNSLFSTRMHLVYGDARLVDTLMRDPTSTERPSLKITQRLRMDLPKLEEVERRISLSGEGGWCVLLVMPGSNDCQDVNGPMQQRPLKNLVSYLRQKDAAGVLSLPPSSKHGCETGLLHTFPPCAFAHRYLLKHAPGLVSDFASEDHIIVFLVRVNV